MTKSVPDSVLNMETEKTQSFEGYIYIYIRLNFSFFQLPQRNGHTSLFNHPPIELFSLFHYRHPEWQVFYCKNNKTRSEMTRLEWEMYLANAFDHFTVLLQLSPSFSVSTQGDKCSKIATIVKSQASCFSYITNGQLHPHHTHPPLILTKNLRWKAMKSC